MRTIGEIKKKFPTLYKILGKEYIGSLQSEQGALAKRATINPFFSILYNKSNEQESDFIENCFSYAVKKECITLERLQRFKDEKKSVNLQNFINEIVSLRPIFEFGNFLDEKNIGVTPDFLASFDEGEIVFECVSVNESSNSEKQRNKSLLETSIEQKKWKKENPDRGVFITCYETQPYGTIELNKIIEKIRRKKTSRQVGDFQYKVLVMSFRNMIFTNSSECLPNKCNQVDGIHSGIIYHAFYGKKGDIVYQGNSFEGEEHKLSILEGDGKFRRDSNYNLCIVNFNTEVGEECNQYTFLENLKNPMPQSLINKLCDAFKPYATHSILQRYIEP